MKRILVTTALLAGFCSANAQGLLGTSASVFESSFCKKWNCEFLGKAVSKDGVESFTYITRDIDYIGGGIDFKVFRVNKVIKSAVVVFGAQDTIFHANGEINEFMRDWAKQFGDSQISAQQIASFEGSSGFEYPSGAIPLRKGTLSCESEGVASSNGYGGYVRTECWLRAR